MYNPRIKLSASRNALKHVTQIYNDAVSYSILYNICKIYQAFKQ